MKKDVIKEKLEKAKAWVKGHRKKGITISTAAAGLVLLVIIALFAVRIEPAATEPVTAVKEDEEEDDKKEDPFGGEKEPEDTKSVSEDTKPAEDGGREKNVRRNTETDDEKEPLPTPSATDSNTAGQVTSKETRTQTSAGAASAGGQERVYTGTPAATPAPVVQSPAPEPAPVQEPVHEHTWVPVNVTIHHDAVTHTVHHDPVTQTVHHDAVTHEEPVYEFRTICNTCGADITGHIPDHIGPVCQGSYSAQQIQTGVNVVTDNQAYDEEVVVLEAWDETVTDQAAYDDVVTTGYRCSECGVMQQ